MVSAFSLVVSFTSIHFVCSPPFFQSKYWIMIGNIFTAPWLLPSVQIPQYWISFSASRVTSTEWGAKTPFTMALVLVFISLYKKQPGRPGHDMSRENRTFGHPNLSS